MSKIVKLQSQATGTRVGDPSWSWRRVEEACCRHFTNMRCVNATLGVVAGKLLVQLSVCGWARPQFVAHPRRRTLDLY